MQHVVGMPRADHRILDGGVNEVGEHFQLGGPGGTTPGIRETEHAGIAARRTAGMIGRSKENVVGQISTIAGFLVVLRNIESHGGGAYRLRYTPAIEGIIIVLTG